MIIISTYCIIKNECLAFTDGDLMVYTSKAIGSTIKRLSKKEQEQVDSAVFYNTLHYSQCIIFASFIFLAVQTIALIHFYKVEGSCDSLFFLITGLQGLYVILVLILVVILYFRIEVGSFILYSESGLTTIVFYLHFNNLVWSIYLLSGLNLFM